MSVCQTRYIPIVIQLPEKKLRNIKDLHSVDELQMERDIQKIWFESVQNLVFSYSFFVVYSSFD